MELEDFYPSPSDLVKNEVDVLNYLRNDPYIKEKHGQFAQDAGTYYGKNRFRVSGFEFNSHLDVWHAPLHRKKEENRKPRKNRPNARLTVSARIELTAGAFSNVTYCLGVFRIRTNRFVILRKFHFDVTVSANETKRRLQQHPRCHLQYCGEMVPHMAKMGCRQTQLDQMFPWLSEPRIFIWPMSLALLIDMALHEFPDQSSAKFRKGPEWRGIVRAHEALVVRPFCAKCVEIIDDNRNENLTLAEAFYIG
jgi:hypothetical protein